MDGRLISSKFLHTYKHGPCLPKYANLTLVKFNFKFLHNHFSQSSSRPNIHHYLYIGILSMSPVSISLNNRLDDCLLSRLPFLNNDHVDLLTLSRFIVKTTSTWFLLRAEALFIALIRRFQSEIYSLVQCQ